MTEKPDQTNSENEATTIEMSFFYKLLFVVFLVTFLLLYLAPEPDTLTVSEATEQIYQDHPECRDKLVLTKEAIAVPDFNGSATVTYGYYLKCEEAGISLPVVKDN